MARPSKRKYLIFIYKRHRNGRCGEKTAMSESSPGLFETSLLRSMSSPTPLLGCANCSQASIMALA